MTASRLEPMLHYAGFVAFLAAPAFGIYAISAFATWDLTWIATEEAREARVLIAIVNALWLLMLSIAASGS